MQTVTIELTNNNALKLLQNLEELHLIKIVREQGKSSYALSGEPISEEDFKLWIEYTENLPTVDLIEAKQRWAIQKKKLQKLIP
jgi:hypothetical protein